MHPTCFSIEIGLIPFDSMSIIVILNEHPVKCIKWKGRSTCVRALLGVRPSQPERYDS